MAFTALVGAEVVLSLTSTWSGRGMMVTSMIQMSVGGVGLEWGVFAGWGWSRVLGVSRLGVGETLRSLQTSS